MRYKIRSESWSPNQKNLNLVDKVIASVKPDADLLDWYLEYSQFHRTRYAHDLDFAKKYFPAQSKIVEFGSVPPILTVGLDDLGYSIFGVDIDPDRFISIIQANGLNVYKVNIETEQLPFAGGEFDGAIFNEIFEHLRINPIHVMKNVHRVIKPGGRLLLSTPNLTSLYGWYNLIIKNKTQGDIFEEYEKLEKLNHMGHVRLYTPVEVAGFLEKIGFIVEEVIYRGYYKIPRWATLEISVKSGLAIFPWLKPYFSVIARRSFHD